MKTMSRVPMFIALYQQLILQSSVVFKFYLYPKLKCKKKGPYIHVYKDVSMLITIQYNIQAAGLWAVVRALLARCAPSLVYLKLFRVLFVVKSRFSISYS